MDKRKLESKVSHIVHVQLCTRNGSALLFRRSDGYWMPISGKVDPGETYIETAVRETGEEANLILDPRQVVLTDHRFSAVSPRGKLIRGATCFAVLPQSFNLSGLKFNEELTDAEILHPEHALDLLNRKGLPEAADGFSHLVSHWSQQVACLGVAKRFVTELSTAERQRSAVGEVSWTDENRKVALGSY